MQSNLPKKITSGLPRARYSSLTIIFLLSLFLGLYAWLRYRGNVGQGDTAVFTMAIRNMIDGGTLIPSTATYDNGYGYQSIVIFLHEFTGLSLYTLQVAGGTLLLAWVVVPAWLLYREFTQSNRIALLAVLLLLVQPEFLFPLLRGTHEKFTRGMMFFIIYLLLRSLRSKNIAKLLNYIVIFYLSTYALITLNNLMSSSFIFGIGLVVLILWGVQKFFRNSVSVADHIIKRLGFITISSLILAFIFTFYAYPPAQKQIFILQSVSDQVASLLLNVEESAYNPYGVVMRGWVSMPVYYLVSLANWVVLIGSFAIWLWQTWRWLIKKDRLSQPAIFLWAFYLAYGFQGGLSILVDVSGAIAANLQHRMFPSFIAFAVPVVAVWINQRIQSVAAHKRIWLTMGTGLVLGLFMLLAVVKATSDPLVSNQWFFYTPAEYQAVRWAEQSLDDDTFAIGFNDRVGSGYWVKENGLISPIDFEVYGSAKHVRNFMVSKVTQLQSERYFVPVPIEPYSSSIYHNGDAMIFRLRPKTPFQR